VAPTSSFIPIACILPNIVAEANIQINENESALRLLSLGGLSDGGHSDRE
jgi:hypothetical protein